MTFEIVFLRKIPPRIFSEFFGQKSDREEKIALYTSFLFWEGFLQILPEISEKIPKQDKEDPEWKLVKALSIGLISV